MAKKKVMQQLDLFGGLFAEEPPITNEIKTELIHLVEPTIDTKQELINEEISNPPDQRDVIFANNNIGVKIKLKAASVIASEIIDEKVIEPRSTKNEQPKTSNKEHHTPNTKHQLTNKKQATKTKSKRGRKSFKEMDDEIGLVNIPDDEVLNKKLYYPIREVAAFFNVNTSLIRAWEVEFDVLQPRKNRKGDRLFRVEDIKNLQIIYFLLRNKKFSVDGAKKYLKENKSKVDTNQQLLQTLTRFRSFLVEIKNNLQHV